MNLLRLVGGWSLMCALSLLFSWNACSAETVLGPEKWEKEIAAFESRDAESPPEKGGSFLWEARVSVFGRRWQRISQSTGCSIAASEALS